MVRSGWQRWASATFTGARHQLVLQAPPSDALDAWLGTLGEAEIALPGHLVADLHLDHVARGAERVEATLAVLTVETV
ncbi:MAG: hypothetical protein K2Y03_08515 [Sphingomonas sp.]|nr:hypothetical protein [Sphingomonas sp.]